MSLTRTPLVGLRLLRQAVPARQLRQTQSSSTSNHLTRAIITRNASTSTQPESNQSTESKPSESESGKSPKSSRRWLKLSALLAVPALAYAFWPSNSRDRTLSPQYYSLHKVGANRVVSGQHTLLSIPISRGEVGLFKNAPPSASAASSSSDPSSPNPSGTGSAGVHPGVNTGAVTRSGTAPAPNEIVIQHIMLGAPQIQIERPYTPVNDPVADGYADMVIKRVRGGEVGRLAHSFKPGEEAYLRGPITSFSIVPGEYEDVVMISTGTALSPFLQLLSKATPSLYPNTRFTLLHANPAEGREDWAESAGFLPKMREKWGPQLDVRRVGAGVLPERDVREVLGMKGKEGKVMVLVCLPPNLMRPLCGPLTLNLDQGPLTGLLAELGLRPDQVWKLE